MFYLQKVRICLGTRDCGEQEEQNLSEVLERLAQRLKNDGCCVERAMDSASVMKCAGDDTNCGGKMADMEDGNVHIVSDCENILWITDSGTVAGRLSAWGCAVLAFLHEWNRQEDFSVCRYACEGLEELDMVYLERVYRRLRGLPWDILETERCLIRETTVEDVEDFYRIYKKSAITEYMEPLYEDPEQERAYARDYIDQVYAFYGFGIWTVAEKVTGQVIGRAGICYREGFEDPELGFVIAMESQGQGYATEVCRAILSYAAKEHGFHRVLAFVQPGNAASQRVCSKLGMGIAGRIRLKGTEYEIRVWED